MGSVLTLEAFTHRADSESWMRWRPLMPDYQQSFSALDQFDSYDDLEDLDDEGLSQEDLEALWWLRDEFIALSEGVVAFLDSDMNQLEESTVMRLETLIEVIKVKAEEEKERREEQYGVYSSLPDLR